MRIYTVHERPGAVEDGDLVLVKEGFCWPAFVVAPLWLFYHRLWLGLVVYFGALAVLAALGAALGADEISDAVAGVGFGLVIGFEANDWRRRSLTRWGFAARGLCTGRDLDDAERRLFERRLHAPPPPSPSPAPPPAAAVAARALPDDLSGLLP